MLVSHEVPLKALEKSLEFNDYDYALVHLFKAHEEYYDFYKKSLSNNRTVYLDNSAYELKELYNVQNEMIDKFNAFFKSLRYNLCCFLKYNPTKRLNMNFLDTIFSVKSKVVLSPCG